MRKSALCTALSVIAALGLISCNKTTSIRKPPSGLVERVLVSQSASSPTAQGALIIVNGLNDTLGRGAIAAGNSPGLMITDPQRSVLLAFDSASNRVEVINTRTEANTGSIQLPGPTTSLIAPLSTIGFAAVPTAQLTGSAPGAVDQLDLVNGGIVASIEVPAVQTVVSNPTAVQVLAFSSDSDSVTVVYPGQLNSGNPLTVTVPGFDRPVTGFFNGTTAYILNCGAECGGTQASVQILDLSTSTPTAGAAVPVDGATIGLINSNTLYVAGNSPANSACTGETTAATTCGRVDTVDLGSLTVTASAVITDGYHNRIDMGLNGQLFIGAHTCTNVGNVNNVSGEVRGCLSIYNTNDGSVTIPADNGDVTGLQGFTSRYVEYVAEGGNLRVYDTRTDTLLDNSFISTGTIVITGKIIDAKAVDFF